MIKFKKGEKVEVMKKNEAHVSWGIDKISRGGKEKAGKPSTARVKNAIISDEAEFLDSHKISSRSLKRMSQYESCILEAHNRCIKKFRAIEENGLKLRLVTVPLLENQYHQIEKPKQCEDSDVFSVGSCSIFNQSSNNFYNFFRSRIFQNEADDTSSDAESCCYRGFKSKTSYILQNEEARACINRLELYAYRRILEALYSSGPLSWELEEMLTNLRIMLHISNDVHLVEVKNLISSKTAI